jgi:iron(III) transport system substrate-binding protein
MGGPPMSRRDSGLLKKSWASRPCHEMLKNLSILLLLAAIVALPFLFRHTDNTTAWHEGDPVLVIVTPHNEAIRYEFEHGFSKWHQAKYGRPVKIEWRAIGGTTEIMRYLTSEYASAAKFWWARDIHKPWPDNGAEAVVAANPPTQADQLDLYKTFRDTDKPEAFTARIDLFFGGGQFDHSSAYAQGLIVPPWKPGEEPKSLFALAIPSTQHSAFGTQHSEILIPQTLSGEIWRTPQLFGNVISTFGICYNVDRLHDLHVAKPPTAWADLADPVYFAQVGATDPTKSGSVAKAFEMMIHQRIHDTVRAAGYSDSQIAAFEKQIDAYIKEKGKAYQRGDIPPAVPAAYQQAIEAGWLDGIHLVQRIGANARYFTDSASKVPIDVSTGDAAVGMAIDFYGRFQAQASRAPDGHDRMIYLTPIGGSSVSCDPISLLRGAEHRDVAIRFIEFALSEEGQKLWCYKPGEPASAGGPEKYALRRLPIRRDFYPSTNPIIEQHHEEHLKHASDNLADPAIDPYTLAQQFTYYYRWTGQHFAFHRDLIRIMCMDSGDELKEAWQTINAQGGLDRQQAAMQTLGQLPNAPLYDPKTKTEAPVQITWRTAPDLIKKYEKLEYTRKWTQFFRQNYYKAKSQVTTNH